MFASRFFDSPLSPFHSTRMQHRAFDSPFQQDPFFQNSQTYSNINSMSKSDSQNEEKYAEPAVVESSKPSEPTIRPVQDTSSKVPTSNNARTRPSTSRVRDSYRGYLSPFEPDLHPEFDMIGFPLSHSLHRMERLMDQLGDPFAAQHAWGQNQLPRLRTTAGDAPVSYSTTSSYSSHQSGSEAPLVYQSHSESRSVGGVSETKSRWVDSLGNERCIELRRLGDQSQEVISDKNSSGEQRQHQNLNQIAPEKVDQFNQEWKQRFHWDATLEQPLALQENTLTPQLLRS